MHSFTKKSFLMRQNRGFYLVTGAEVTAFAQNVVLVSGHVLKQKQSDISTACMQA
jgi:hypothetical protein